MNNVLPMHTQQNEMGELATIQGGFNRDFMVQSTRGVFKAKQAFSCVINPEIGDRVLVNQCDGECYILAIVDRPTNDDMTIAFPGNAKMVAKEGDLELISGESCKITSAYRTDITTASVNINVLESNVVTEQANIRGNKLTNQWLETNMFSKAINVVTDVVTQKIKNSFKTVDGVEQKKSVNFLQNVTKTLSIRSRDSVFTARKDVKIDGERIHMG